MRAIKFRAFDTLQGGKFEYWDSKTNKYDGIFWDMIKNKSFKEPNEFTGLKDKNGVEIYEGDILKVELFSKMFFISFGKSEKWGACFCIESFNSITFLTKNCSDTSEVIGNIYQNAELLQAVA